LLFTIPCLLECIKRTTYYIMQNYLSSILTKKILPAITFYDAMHAVPVAEALLAAGLNVMEVPLRTGEALKAIEAICKAVPEMQIGAGTILNAQQLNSVINAGAQFGLAPGFNPAIARQALELNFPFIPGVMTPSEIELACEMGYNILKLFPAGQVGGPGFLKAVDAPYAQLNVQFIPMGGVNLGNLATYVKLPNVIAVGGSWLVTKQLMEAKDYKTIEQNITAALQRIHNH